MNTGLTGGRNNEAPRPVLSCMQISDIPLPATPEARKLGCSCPDFDPQQAVEGETQMPDPNCPLHGVTTTTPETE